MQVNDLTLKYPDIIEKCREWDCDFEEVIRRKKMIARGETLDRWM